jgi:hypothetical protein
MKYNNKNSNLHPEAAFGGHFAELRGFGVARRGGDGCPAPAESPDFAPLAAADAAGTMPSECASLK